MEKSTEYLKIPDRFNLDRTIARYAIVSSLEMEFPDIAYKAQRIHGASYVRTGYINPEALMKDGRIAPELDGSRGDGGNNVVVNYLLALEQGKSIEEAGASVRLIDVAECGDISDLPTCKYFEDSNTDVAEYVNKLTNSSSENINIREIAALSNVSFSDDVGSYELMRAIMQNSLMKKAEHDLNEIYLVSLTEKSLRPIIRLAGRKAVQIIGSPVKVYADDPRQKEVNLTPVLLDPNKAIVGLLEELKNAKTNFVIKSLKQQIAFLSDGLSEYEIGEQEFREIKTLLYLPISFDIT